MSTLPRARLSLELILLTFLVLSILPLIISFPGHSVHAQSQDVSRVYIDPTSQRVNSMTNIQLNVRINLTSTQINALDVRLNYTDAITSIGGVARVKSIDYSTGIFANGQVIAECVDGVAIIGGGCPTGDSPSPGQVHFASALLGSSVTGPLTGALLFTLNVDVKGSGQSIFSFDRAHFVNQGADPNFPNPRFIGIVSWDGVVANSTGVVAFFNSEPSSPPAYLPNQVVWFNASRSLPSLGASLASFTWDFNDTSGGTGISAPHIFLSPGTFQVKLTVTDSLGQVGYVSRPVVIVDALGGLDLTIKDHARGTARGGVLVQLENTTTPVQIFNKTTDFSGGASFRGLSPGQYVLLFSGGGLQAPSPAKFTVSAGLISMDTLYLNFVDPVPPSDLSGIIFIGTVVGGVALVAVAAFLKRRQSKRLAASPKPSRSKRI